MWKRRLRIVVVILLFLLAVSMTAYPYIANFIFEHRNDSLVNTIEQSVDELAKAEKQAAFRAAREYNRSLFEGHVQLKDPFESESEDLSATKYHQLLNVNGDGVMGLVEIPVIDVKLPIYHTTSNDVLERGIGHLEGTSLPVGGENTNCVLTGHTGLSNAKLFTDLSELSEGDYFFLWILGERLAYKVTGTSVVLPNEVNEMYPVDGMDICTLVTCTPYGINTHRLLVRGVRTDYDEAISDPAVLKRKPVESKWMMEYKRALLISAECFVVGLILLIGIRKIINRKRYGSRTGQ